jgi:hypothetical protein
MAGGMDWLRLWHDMPNDPKWRTIARMAGKPISLVLSVYVHLLVDASRNVTRGHVDVTLEDLASALDVTEDDIRAVMDAMQGRVIDGGVLSGWDRRQPKREDAGNPETGAKSAAQRKREQRERASDKDKNTQCHDESQNVTQCHDREEKRREDKEEKIKSKAESATGTRLPADWIPSFADARFCADERPDLSIDKTASQFRDYWIAKPGAKGRKTDWPATWRNWVRNQHAAPQARASPSKPDKFDPTAYVNRQRTQPNERTIDLDATGEPV